MAPPEKPRREIGFHVREKAARYRTRNTRMIAWTIYLTFAGAVLVAVLAARVCSLDRAADDNRRLGAWS